MLARIAATLACAHCQAQSAPATSSVKGMVSATIPPPPLCQAQGRRPNLPGDCARTCPLMPVGCTSQRSVQILGFDDICRLAPLCRLYPLPVRQASALPSASSRFPVTQDTLAVRLTLPLAGCVEDFHLQVRAPCRAHKKKPRRSGADVGCGNAYCLRRRENPSPARPRPSSASVAGSGVRFGGVVELLNEPLIWPPGPSFCVYAADQKTGVVGS